MLVAEYTRGQQMSLIKSDQQSFPMDIAESPLAVVAVVKNESKECEDALLLLESCADSYPAVQFFQVDVNESPFLAAQLNISALPTLIGWRQGSVMWVRVGTPQVDDLTARLAELCSVGLTND